MSQFPDSFPSQPQSVRTERTGLAIAALVFGILGLLIPLLGIVGVILGIIALSTRRGGKGMAIGGIACGVASTFMICAMAGILLPALGKARQSARDLKSSTQIRAIGQALQMYASENKDWMPETAAGWESRLTKYGVSQDLLISPHAPESRTTSYIYLPPGRPVDASMPATTILAYEDPRLVRRHAVVLFADGSVNMLDKPDLRARLEAQGVPIQSADFSTPGGPP